MDALSSRPKTESAAVALFAEYSVEIAFSDRRPC
jgi:hypothetical protein